MTNTARGSPSCSRTEARRSSRTAHRIRVPLRAGQQALHAVGPCLARVLGELPAVLALDRAEQSVARAAHPLAWLGAREAWPDPLLDPAPPRIPRANHRLCECLPA